MWLFKMGAVLCFNFFSAAAYIVLIYSGLFPLTGRKIAEVPVLRLRQAFWLFAVGGCKPDCYHSVMPLRRLFYHFLHKI
jgi:hypothetical protein